MHELLARISNVMAEAGDGTVHEGMFRQVYGALKHAGNNKRKISASNDLYFEADLKKEAAYMLDAAKDDFRNIEVSSEIRSKLSESFLALLEGAREYAEHVSI